MKNYIVYEKNSGSVISFITEEKLGVVMDHHAVLEYAGAAAPDFQTLRVVDGELVESITPQYFTYLKQQHTTNIEVARDAAVAAGVPTQWGTFQADLQSSTNINGAVSMAILGGDSFEIEWRTADNQTVSLDGPSMIQLGVLVGKFVSAVYKRSWELKAQVNAALIPGDLASIVIDFSDITDGEQP